MFNSKFPKLLIFITASILSAAVFAVDNPYLSNVSSSVNSYNQNNNSKGILTGSSNMNAAQDATESVTKPTSDGVFTIANGQKCIPSCEGTFLSDGQTVTAILFLKDAYNAMLVAPYSSKDSLNLKQLMAQKNAVNGTWKPKEDGTIEFKALTSKKSVVANTDTANTTTNTNPNKIKTRRRSYNNYYNNGYYDNY